MEFNAELDHCLLPDGLTSSDLHLQTSHSDGTYSPDAMLRAASLCGLQSVAICDHLSEDQFKDGSDTNKYLLKLNKAARAQTTLTVYKGVEVTLLDTRDSALSTPDKHLDRFDLVLAELSMHTKGIGADAPSDRGKLLDNIRKSYCSLCEHPQVNICSSPFALGRTIPGFGLDWIDHSLVEEVAAAFKETNTFFELNTSLWMHFPHLSEAELIGGYSEILETFRGKDVPMVIGSSAHSVEGVGNHAFAQRIYETVRV